MEQFPLIGLFTIAAISVSIVHAQETATVKDALAHIITLEIPSSGYPVERTVAEAMRKVLAQNSTIVEASAGQAPRRTSFRIHVMKGGTETSPGWFRLQLSPDGTGELTASHAHMLYTAF